jgi:hypothetical protein
MKITFLLALSVVTLVGTAPAEVGEGQTEVSPARDAFAPLWTPIPLLSPEAQQAGIFPGGEGAQWPRGPIAVSPADPGFLLLPIDVGGVYRSIDGGKHWQIAMVGWNARGANGFAIDPGNANRVIGIAANSLNWNDTWGPSPLGLYLSSDKAASWHQVLATPEAFGGKIVFDPTSYDARRRSTLVVYHLSGDHGLLISRDGGVTWAQAVHAPSPGVHKGGDWNEGLQVAPQIAVESRNGAVYLAGANGLFCSEDRAHIWRHLRTEPVYSLAIAPEGTVFISETSGILVSRDAGRTFEPLPGAGLEVSSEHRVQGLVVSPADQNRMLCWTSGKGFVWTRYVTEDGGKTWQKVTVDKTFAPLPQNSREGYATWSPNDPKVAWSIGGDWVTKSVDGGRTFSWSNNGYNGVMTGGLFRFSSRNPNTFFVGFQDYNGAFTTNGGTTWNYRDVSGKGWGGHEYGAFAASKGKVMWAGDAESWNAPRRLRLTRDGGATWAFVVGPEGTPWEFHGAEVSMEDPLDDRYLFASDLRSTDRGATWARMDDCEGVFAVAPSGKTLYGKKGDAIVSSVDHGGTWQTVTRVDGGFSDLAVDESARRFYVASQDRLKVWDGMTWTTLETPRDQFSNSRVSTVAIDPKDGRVVYVGGPMNLYASAATICRSTDGGKTWRNLTVTLPLAGKRPGGPHEVSCIQVHPITREAWVAGQCFGLWRIGPPAPGETGVSAAAASMPKAQVAPQVSAIGADR